MTAWNRVSMAAATAAVMAACGGGGTNNSPDATAPRGEVRLRFSWRIDGQDPRAAATACRDADVQVIRMTVVDVGGTTPRQTLSWDCNLGRYESAQGDLPAGEFGVYWEALSSAGRVRSIAPARRDGAGMVVPAPQTATLPAGGLVDFDATNTVNPGSGVPTNFATASGPLDVTLDHTLAAGGTGTCAQAGVSTITWQLVAPTGLATEDHQTREECARYAHIHWDSVILDEYALVVTGRDAAGNVVERGRCEHLLARRDATQSMYHCTVARAP